MQVESFYRLYFVHFYKVFYAFFLGALSKVVQFLMFN